MGQTTKFRPHAIAANKADVGRVRELAVRYDIPYNRVYGLAIEYAVDRDGFEMFVQNEANPDTSNETD